MSIKIALFSRTKGPIDASTIPGRHLGVFEYSKVREGILRRFVIGFLRYSADDLVALRKRGWKLDARVIGVLKLGPDVTPHLASETIVGARVSGWFNGPNATRSALKAR